jgi:hypothetical protein
MKRNVVPRYETENGKKNYCQLLTMRGLQIPACCLGGEGGEAVFSEGHKRSGTGYC